MFKLGIAGIVKNEASALIEWIAFHRALGIDKFFIADNESTDGTKELLTTLSSIGFVETISVATLSDEKPQLPAYKDLLSLANGKVDVLGFIDADEFVTPTNQSPSIKPFIEEIFSDQEISALALNWATFGSAGAIFIEDGLVIERFTRRAKIDININHHYKTFVRPERASGFLNPHHANLKSGRYVTPLRNELIFHPNHGKGLSESVTWEGARVNHYATKSLEEFLVGKSQRGSASKFGRIKHKTYFLAHDRNEEECQIAKAFAQATLEEMSRLNDEILAGNKDSNNSHAHRFFDWIEKKITRS